MEGWYPVLTVEYEEPKYEYAPTRDLDELLKDLDVDSYTFAELKAIFKKCNKLEFIELPEYVEEIIHPRTLKSKPLDNLMFIRQSLHLTQWC